MIDTDWYHRLIQSLDYAVGFELILLLGPGRLAEPALARLADALARFGTPRWHPLHAEGLDSLLDDGPHDRALHLVHGLEQLPDPAARGIVARLNLNRERLRELDAPVLFWIPREFYEEFLRQAPDLVAWRSQVELVSASDFGLDDTKREAGTLARTPRATRVLITYSHESSSHDERVLALAQQLRADGIDAWLDRFDTAPAQGWPRWMQEQLERADLVIMVCTATFRRRFDRDLASGDISLEGIMAATLLQQTPRDSKPLVPVVFEGGSLDDIPSVAMGSTVHVLPQEYESLRRQLTHNLAVAPTPMTMPTQLGPGSPETLELRDELAALAEHVEQLETKGEDTSEIRARILEIRRRLRAGPILSSGAVLGGRYHLIEVAGQGAFAHVWKAYDRLDQRITAVKVLHAQWARDRSKVERFERGARHMARLHHPAIVPILNPTQIDGWHHYFVMPWLERGDLHAAVAAGTIEQDAALLACARALEGLAHAHNHGVIHRDVKPSNILLDAYQLGWITDFDLVQAFDSTGGTRTGAMGTFTYAAPELLEDASRADVRADVYGAGMCVLFALLGRNPPALPALTKPTLLEDLPCSSQLREAIGGAIAYDRSERTTTTSQLIAAVRDFVATPTASTRPDSLTWTVEGVDEYGRWASFRVGEIEQRMRWIEGGTFSMGSPVSELGRHEHEGPQHQVTITRGHWLAETACSQALWTAVMDRNPSRFESPDRPVEQVSWDDVQRFLVLLGDLLPNASFGLPTEAQWEYACRAGTSTPTYADDAVVDEIAWYWDNSGGTTHPVGLKRPNSLGLYDMLGNTWEWCADSPRTYDIHPIVDPRGSDHDRRVCRGGSWGGDVRFVRAACRAFYEPDYRYGSVGFRLVRTG